MRLLLDSHAALWTFQDAPDLSRSARNAIVAANATVFYSPVSAYELGLKASLGKLEPLLAPFAELSEQLGFQELPVATSHAELAARLPLANRDPFDRLLVAQALLENCTLVSRDRKLALLGAPMLW